MSGMSRMSSGAVVGEGLARQGWWLVAQEASAFRVVAGPFSDRVEAGIAADPSEHRGRQETHPVFGTARADGGFDRMPSPEDRAWFAHVADQLERLDDDWDAGVSDEDPMVTLIVEVVAALSETGLPLYDSTGVGRELGGVCVTPEAGLGGILASWRQHDRVVIDQIHDAASVLVQDAMNCALSDVLSLRGFRVDAFGEGSGLLIRQSSDRCSGSGISLDQSPSPS